MEPNTFTIYYQVGSLITNIAILLVGVKLVRHITMMEMKVEMMWDRFQRTFDIRAEDIKRAGRKTN